MAIKRKTRSARKQKDKPAARKPKPTVVVKRRLAAERIEDAQHALDLLTAWMRNADLPFTFRRTCANDVMDRVLGKPVQAQATGGDAAYREHLARLRAAILGETDGAEGEGGWNAKPANEEKTAKAGMHRSGGAEEQRDWNAKPANEGKTAKAGMQRSGGAGEQRGRGAGTREGDGDPSIADGHVGETETNQFGGGGLCAAASPGADPPGA